MNSLQIKYVLTVAGLKSISKAAKKLHVTQPSLSQYIQKIENQLGFTIFDRSISPLKLTEEGEIFIDAAEKIHFLEDNMMNKISDIANLKTGNLKIGSSSFRASCLLSKSISEFKKLYPGIKISILEDDIHNLMNSLSNCEIDLVISVEDVKDTLYHCEELSEERLYIATPKSHDINNELKDYRLTYMDIKKKTIKFIKNKTPDLSCFFNIPLIASTSGEYCEEYIYSIFKEKNISKKPDLTVKNIETAFSFTNSELGMSIIPDTLICFGNHFEHPYFYPINSPLASRKINIISKKNEYFSKAASQYCLILKNLVAAGTWIIV